MRRIFMPLTLVLTSCSFYSLSDGDGCFIAGTQVMTPQGAVAIETLQPDDEVISFDEASGNFTIGVVEGVIGRQAKNVLQVTLSNNDALGVTAEHPVLTSKLEWIPIGDLAVGQALLGWQKDHAKAAVAISAMTNRSYSGTVYNVKVRHYENAVVEGLVAHFY